MTQTNALRPLLDARLRQVVIPELDPPPSSEDEAYCLQHALHQRLSMHGYGRRVGFKIGCTTEVMQQYLGIRSPCAGGVFEYSVHHNHGEFKHTDFIRVGVECELAVRLGCDIKARAHRYERDEVVRAVAALMCAIEVVDDRWRDYRTVSTASLIADDFFAAGCVLGHAHDDWHGLALDALQGSMRINGQVIGQGSGRDILGDPLQALLWLANDRAARGLDMVEGEIVLLGSMVQTQWLAPGDHVQVEVAGLGQASAAFVS